MKLIPGRRYIPTTKIWLVPATKDNIENVLSLRWSRVLASSLPPIAGLLGTCPQRGLITPQGPFKTGLQAPYPTPETKPIILPKGLELYPFQEETVRFIESRNGRALVALEMGCIDGEAILNVNRGGRSFKCSLENAFKRSLPGNKYSWDPSTPTSIRSLKDGVFRLHRVKKFLAKGIKPVLKITTESGKTIKLTPDHELLTPTGWKGASTLSVGEEILTNGIPICPHCGSSENIITYKYAKFKGYCRKCVFLHFRENRNQVEDIKRIGKDGYVYLKGSKYHDHPRYFSSGLLEHILLMEQTIGRPLTDDEKVHHKNEIRSDNSPENLQLVTKSEHKKIHKAGLRFNGAKTKGGNEIVLIPKIEKIIEIINAGSMATYDIVMEGPYHNFVANEIVVHNCGKTPTALVWLRLHPEFRPAIVICPASLRINWAREATKWLDNNDSIEILSGRPSESNNILPTSTVLIVNYDILFDMINKKTNKVIVLGWWSILKELNPNVMILDECHYCKSVHAMRTKAVEALASSSDLETSIPHIIGLSGTPIVNRPIEFYTIINLINPKLFPNWWRFTTRYCGRFQKDIYVKGGKKRRVSDFSGATNVDELFSILSNSLMIRKLKRDVLQDLPDKMRSIVPLEIDNRTEYKEAELDFIKWLRKEEGIVSAKKAEKAETLVKLGKLKTLTLRGKLKASISWIKNVIDNDEKLIVFVTRHETADALLSEFGKQAVKLTGKETMEERQSSVDKFQTDENVLLFIGMIDSMGKPAGVGLTLTAATHVAFVGMQWSPLVMDQCEDRAHRIGQKNAVNIYYLVAEKTVEEDMIALLDQKREVLRRVLDGEAPEEGSILTELLEKYRNREV